VSDEDGFAKPESALLELDSSESEESVSLELEVSGPPLLDSISKGSDSPESDSEALGSSGSVSDDSDSGSSGLTGPASDGSGSSARVPDGLESSPESGEWGSQDSKQSVSLSLSEESEEDSDSPPELSAGSRSPPGLSASLASPSQSSLMHLGLFLQARSACLVAACAWISQGRVSMGGLSWWHCLGPSSSAFPPSRSPTCLRAFSTPSTALSIHALASL
jgi:hypothetical protein